jgi:hypothetical protein
LVLLLAACGSGSTLEPVGAILFVANDDVPVDLFDPPGGDEAGSLVEWEEVQLLDADRLGVIFAAGEGSCGNPSSVEVVETPTTVLIGVRASNSECTGPGTFKAVQVQLGSRLGSRTILNELCHNQQTTQLCGPVDELSGARLAAEGSVSYLDS